MRPSLCVVLLSSCLAAPLITTESGIEHHRSKRQLGEVAVQISNVLSFIVTVGSQSIAQVGRLGQDIVGENSGGLLALLESVFVGVEVSSDIFRNFLNSIIGTLDTVLGTPKEEESLVSGNGGNRKSDKQRLQNKTKSEPKKSSDRPKTPLPGSGATETSLGKMISADLREINEARRRFWTSLQKSRREMMPRQVRPLA